MKTKKLIDWLKFKAERSKVRSRVLLDSAHAKNSWKSKKGERLEEAEFYMQEYLNYSDVIAILEKTESQ